MKEINDQIIKVYDYSKIKDFSVKEHKPTIEFDLSRVSSYLNISNESRLQLKDIIKRFRNTVNDKLEDSENVLTYNYIINHILGNDGIPDFITLSNVFLISRDGYNRVCDLLGLFGWEISPTLINNETRTDVIRPVGSARKELVEMFKIVQGEDGDFYSVLDKEEVCKIVYKNPEYSFRLLMYFDIYKDIGFINKVLDIAYVAFMCSTSERVNDIIVRDDEYLLISMYRQIPKYYLNNSISEIVDIKGEYPLFMDPYECSYVYEYDLDNINTAIGIRRKELTDTIPSEDCDKEFLFNIITASLLNVDYPIEISGLSRTHIINSSEGLVNRLYLVTYEVMSSVFKEALQDTDKLRMSSKRLANFIQSTTDVFVYDVCNIVLNRKGALDKRYKHTIYNRRTLVSEEEKARKRAIVEAYNVLRYRLFELKALGAKFYDNRVGNPNHKENITTSNNKITSLRIYN